MPIWNPFIAWMAVWALDGLSKLTKPGEGGRNERGRGNRDRNILK
jgi:hypothetical protein